MWLGKPISCKTQLQNSRRFVIEAARIQLGKIIIKHTPRTEFSLIVSILRINSSGDKMSSMPSGNDIDEIPIAQIYCSELPKKIIDLVTKWFVFKVDIVFPSWSTRLSISDTSLTKFKNGDVSLDWI